MRRNASILVVDDEEIMREILETLLVREGYAVRLAADGAEGLELAKSLPFDAVILDVMMPRMDGLEVARALQGDPATAPIPVLLLSAKAQEADLRAGEASGADAYVTKPFDPLDLLQRVEALLAAAA